MNTTLEINVLGNKIIKKADLRAEFEKWIAQPIPEQVLAYDDSHAQLIVDVFVLSRMSTIFDKETNKYAREEQTYPIGKVLQVGKYFAVDKDGIVRHGLANGDLVRLKDMETLTMTNPRYEVWTRNELRNSTMTQEGKAPPKYVQRLWMNYGDRMFALNPFERDMSNWDNSVFFFDTPNILMPIKDWKYYLTHGSNRKTDYLDPVALQLGRVDWRILFDSWKQ